MIATHVKTAAIQTCSQLQQNNAQHVHVTYVFHCGATPFSSEFLNGNSVGRNAAKGHKYTIIVTRYPAEP